MITTMRLLSHFIASNKSKMSVKAFPRGYQAASFGLGNIHNSYIYGGNSFSVAKAGSINLRIAISNKSHNGNKDSQMTKVPYLP